MALSFVKHEKILLKSTPGLSETWLHELICADTSLLGLGELDVIKRESTQHAGGRLDMVLADSENNTRYEVEVMLGATDPSHIIRCIEYWDIERRRYPAYDHVAVIIAEEITTRFLNVMSLMAGSIPLIAIQLNALKIAEHVVLDFVKVLDQQELRDDDTSEAEGSAVDRQWWENRKGASNVQICDRFLEFAREKSPQSYELLYKKSHISLNATGSFFHLAVFWPKQKFVRMRIKLSEAAEWTKRLEAAGLDADSPKEGRVQLRLSPSDIKQYESILREALNQAITEGEA